MTTYWPCPVTADVIPFNPLTWTAAIFDSGTTRRWQLATRIGAFVVVAALLGIGWLVYSGVTVSLKAEENLHSTLFVVRLVDEYVYQNQGWPQSWQELEQMEFDGDVYAPRNGEPSALRMGGTRTFSWPSDSDRLKRSVEINFDAEIAEIAKQNAIEFEAIKPIGPTYEYRDYGIVESLQDTIRAVLDATGLP